MGSNPVAQDLASITAPNATRASKVFEPKAWQIAVSLLPDFPATTAASMLGREVPTESTVRPTMVSGTPRALPSLEEQIERA